MKTANETRDDKHSLYVAAESNANIFNLKCLTVLCLFVLLSVLLNELGLFTVNKPVMRVCAAIAFFLFFLPIGVHIIHDRVVKRGERIVKHPHLKYLIIVCTYLGIAIICVTLSFHAVLLMALPTLIAAQYRDQKHLFFWTLAATILLVPVGVYGSFFFGLPDRNFIKGMLSDEEALNFANRVKIATPKRMLELFTHYILPRLFCVIAVAALTGGIIRRNGRMLKRQEELSLKVKEEMQRRNEMQSRVIDALATLIETRDVGTGEHVARTKRYVRMIADELKKDEKYAGLLTEEELERIEAAAPLHDVGKISVSDTILLKPAKLTEEEFDRMKEHTVSGGNVIRNIFADMEDSKFLRTAEEIAVSHHEKWDGSGYPQGLAGENIPLSARIMAVADVYDALVSVRVYKPAIEPVAAIDTIMNESGTHFDPGIMRVVSGMRDRLIAAANSPLEELMRR